MKVEEEFEPVIIWFGERIFPQKLADVVKDLGEDLTLRAVENHLIVKSTSKIGTDPRRMRSPKGYVQMSNVGWAIYESKTPTQDAGINKNV